MYDVFCDVTSLESTICVIILLIVLGLFKCVCQVKSLSVKYHIYVYCKKFRICI